MLSTLAVVALRVEGVSVSAIARIEAIAWNTRSPLARDGRYDACRQAVGDQSGKQRCGHRGTCATARLIASRLSSTPRSRRDSLRFAPRRARARPSWIFVANNRSLVSTLAPPDIELRRALSHARLNVFELLARSEQHRGVDSSARVFCETRSARAIVGFVGEETSRRCHYNFVRPHRALKFGTARDPGAV